MYDVHNNLAPDNIKNMFTKLSSVHSYRTISVTNENYHVEQVRTENMKRAFSISGDLIWNSIPHSLKTLYVFIVCMLCMYLLFSLWI